MSEVEENFWDIMNHAERVYMSSRVKFYNDDLLRMKIASTSQKIKDLEDIKDKYEHLLPREYYALVVELCFLYADLEELKIAAQQRKMM